MTDPQISRILVLGGSRGIGREIVRQGLARGLAMRAYARHPEDLGLDDPALELVAGDATDPAALAGALEGVDAVAMALGVRLGPQTTLRPVTLFSEATRALLDAIGARGGPRRLVAVTGFGAGDSRAKVSLLERIPFQLVFARAYDDKSRQEEMIEASGLDWTLVRPTILTNGPASQRYKVLEHPSEWRNGMISRADVADFVLRCLTEGSHVHAKPVLAR